MQSDLQSVGTGAISTFARAFAPKCAKLLLLASECLGLFFKTYLERFPASPGAQLQEITSGTLPIQLGQLRLQSPIGSGKTFFSIQSLIVIVFDPVISEKCRR